MIDFLIFYEHINREIENDSLIKYELIKRGYSCEIMPFDGPEYYKKFLHRDKAKVLVVPWLRTDTNICHFSYLGQKPYKIANLQWEQITNAASRKCGMDSFSNNAVKAFHLCWGDYSRKIILNQGGSIKKLPIVGAIQQDYNRKIFKNYYLNKEEIANIFNLNVNKPWILYISSFSLVNVSDKYIDDLVSKYGTYILKDRELNINSEKLTLNWIELLLQSYDCEFIYRPHPTEKTSAHIESLKRKYKNFHVILEYSVKQWAKICDKVNLWISTSNAELISMGVDYNIVRPIKLDFEQEMESMYEEHFVESYDEFLEKNTQKDFEQKKRNLLYRSEKIQKYYNYESEKAAYIRVADALEEILLGDLCQNFEISKEQKRISTKIFKRTMVFSFWISLCAKSKIIFKILPIKKEWKDIVISKTDNYIKGKEIEKRVMEYLKKHEK